MQLQASLFSVLCTPEQKSGTLQVWPICQPHDHHLGFLTNDHATAALHVRLALELTNLETKEVGHRSALDGTTQGVPRSLPLSEALWEDCYQGWT